MHVQLEGDGHPIPFQTRDVPGPAHRWLSWFRRDFPLVLIRDGLVYVDTGRYRGGFRIYSVDHRTMILPGPLDS